MNLAHYGTSTTTRGNDRKLEKTSTYAYYLYKQRINKLVGYIKILCES